MIYHSLRVSWKADAPADAIEAALDHLRAMGREIDVVETWCVGRDFGGEFDAGAMFVLKNIEDYKTYMLHPLHRTTDDVGLPLVDNMISQDLTDDPDPTIGDQIRAVHTSRYNDDPALLKLIEDLDSYTGSGVPKEAAS